MIRVASSYSLRDRTIGFSHKMQQPLVLSLFSATHTGTAPQVSVTFCPGERDSRPRTPEAAVWKVWHDMHPPPRKKVCFIVGLLNLVSETLCVFWGQQQAQPRITTSLWLAAGGVACGFYPSRRKHIRKDKLTEMLSHTCDASQINSCNSVNIYHKFIGKHSCFGVKFKGREERRDTDCKDAS